ncbi:radical SAM protein [Helicobacter marmotae]|uniref:Radical SAM protein n=1 Tax=Helicobacter marmotae TaxID=152490 RepID=A0A3D8I4T7_9HELI|nr:radical SAM protein [Helicobacter marmotae]RDU60016.1 radical SAM protein [Helicobacter marmotae]
MEIIFGPIHSRRFGKSLGVDLSPAQKQCNFDCVYCELQRGKSVDSMQKVIAPAEVLQAIKEALYIHKIDVLTLTANGEPTLYPHLEELISAIKDILPDSIKLLLLTNGSLLWKEEVRRALAKLDIVKFSCDSLEERAFRRIDRPHASLSLEQIKAGIAYFAKSFKGEIVAEVLFVKGINDTLSQAEQIAAFLSTLPLTRVDLGSIDRPPAYKVEAISDEELHKLAQCFYAYPHLEVNCPKRIAHKGQNALKTYTQEQLINLLKRRPLSIKDAQNMFSQETLAMLDSLIDSGILRQCQIASDTFYQVIN